MKNRKLLTYFLVTRSRSGARKGKVSCTRMQATSNQAAKRARMLKDH